MYTNETERKELNTKRVKALFQSIRERSSIEFFDEESDRLNIEEKIYDIERLLESLKKEL